MSAESPPRIPIAKISPKIETHASVPDDRCSSLLCLEKKIMFKTESLK
jgi:hypothetical protein